MTQRLLLTEPQADFLSEAIEEAIETSHEITVENDRESDIFLEAVDRITALLAVLEQIDPDNPIFTATARPGHAFDWESFWASVEEDDGDDVDEDESLASRIAEEEGVSVAPERLSEA